MKNPCKGLAIAAVAAATCGLLTVQNASAQVLMQTTTMPTVYGYNPVVLSSPVVVPRVITQPAVINTTPVYTAPVYDYGYDNHLLHLGLPFFHLDIL